MFYLRDGPEEPLELGVETRHGLAQSRERQHLLRPDRCRFFQDRRHGFGFYACGQSVVVEEID